jgi:hypothetical protein
VLSARFMLGMMLSVTVVLTSDYALANGDSGSPEPSFSINSLAGVTHYSSKLVQNNDLDKTYYLGIGVYGGALRRAGIVVELENGQYGFDLNGASIRTLKLDVSVRYFWISLFGGIVLSTSDLIASAPPDADGDGYLDLGAAASKTIKMGSKHVGVMIGTYFEVSKLVSVFSDLSVEESVDVNETYSDEAIGLTSSSNGSVKMGRYTKFNLGGILQITKKELDFTFGYRLQQLPFSIQGTAYNEKRNTIYAGFRYRAPI